MHYRTKFEIWGLPLVEIKTGQLVNGRYQRGIARAWIAVGDIAFGMLISVGGVAMGGLALGGVSLGVLGLGGLAVGGLALGGCAVGVCAIGGAAIALKIALGGLAVSGDVAMGGLALAPHANGPGTQAALQRFSNLNQTSRWICFAVPLVVFYILAQSRLRAQENARSNTPTHRLSLIHI